MPAAETRQLEAAYSREYQSHSAPIEEVGACNKQSTKARGHLAMQIEITIQGEEGEQNRMAGGGAGQHTTQTSQTLPKDSIKIYRVKVGLGILQFTSAKRCPQVWPWVDRSLFSTNFVEFDQAV